MAPKKARHIQTNWDISGLSVPVKIYFEWRRSRRVSIGKNSVIIRLPWIEQSLNADAHTRWAREWLENQYQARPEIFDHYMNQSYHDGDVIHTTRKSYSLNITKEDRKTGTAKCVDNVIKVKLPKDINGKPEEKMTHTLIGRILSYDNQEWVEKRLRWLNQHYINKPLKSVQLKNNRSNWGSCSTGGNINISVRLLFAPEEVQDYVLVHELAHLKEMNHTANFWKIVEDIMPDYQDKEKWLKENDHLCNF